MKKVITIFVSVFVLLIGNQGYVVASSPTNVSSELSKDSILTLLNPSLQKAVDNYYSSKKEPSRQYGLYDAEILELNRVVKGEFMFKTKIKLSTFSGAHNPPYGQEIITLYFDAGSVKVLDYKHLDNKN